MISAGIVGGSGYAGLELIRILSAHPEVELSVVTSRAGNGKPLGSLHPGLPSNNQLQVTDIDDQNLLGCDVVFFATPHGVAMKKAPKLVDAGVRVIDLSPDFRLKNLKEWAKWYGMDHSAPTLVTEAVYGLPEVNKTSIQDASIVANPGCYATAVQLGLLPTLEIEDIDHSRLIADAKSGISGAGRESIQANLFGEVSENFRAYALEGHRHHPEILQGLIAYSKKKEVNLSFVPHVIPASRGIFVTLYLPYSGDGNLASLFREWYQKSAFVEVLPVGFNPETRFVRGTNRCLISVSQSPTTPNAIVLVVLDNLVKGASGQAVQNMNIMFGISEKAGLDGLCIIP